MFPVEPEGGDGVLGGVVSDSLDPSVQEVPRQELQRHPPLRGPHCSLKVFIASFHDHQSEFLLKATCGEGGGTGGQCQWFAPLGRQG